MVELMQAHVRSCFDTRVCSIGAGDMRSEKSLEAKMIFDGGRFHQSCSETGYLQGASGRLSKERADSYHSGTRHEQTVDGRQRRLCRSGDAKLSLTGWKCAGATAGWEVCFWIEIGMDSERVEHLSTELTDLNVENNNSQEANIDSIKTSVM